MADTNQDDHEIAKVKKLAEYFATFTFGHAQPSSDAALIAAAILVGGKTLSKDQADDVW